MSLQNLANTSQRVSSLNVLFIFHQLKLSIKAAPRSRVCLYLPLYFDDSRALG